jgi:hypothetical protein
MKKWILFASAGLIVLLPLPMLAALGGSVASIQADRIKLRGNEQVRESEAYRIHEISSPTALVREYVSPAQLVFGVTWRGQFVPDLSQLLGAHFPQYTAVVKAQKATYVGRRPLNIQQPGLVVQTGGHMGAFFGRAYVPGMLPQGVTAEDIQ